jgi:hypothetical protein
MEVEYTQDTTGLCATRQGRLADTYDTESR